MSPRVTLATARRVLEQLRSDRRTIAPPLLVPLCADDAVALVYDGQPAVFDRIGPQLLGVFPFVTMFLVTVRGDAARAHAAGPSSAFSTTPMAKLDLLLGYALAFGVAALAQAAARSALTLGVLGLTSPDRSPLVLLVAVANALLGHGARTASSSAFARPSSRPCSSCPPSSSRSSSCVACSHHESR